MESDGTDYTDVELDCQIAVSKPTRKALKALKVGDQTYDALLRQMIRNHDPKTPDPIVVLEK